jgi:glyoxylase-like metal-dependent hydrolase (beta-lactamase superfamily II)
MASNCYLLYDPSSEEIVIIDPGEDANYIAEHVQRLGGTPKVIVATHGHFDHILGAYELQLTFGIPFWIHPADTFLVTRMQETAAHFLGKHVREAPPRIDGALSENQSISLGRHILQVLETPGHTPGSVCLWNKEDGVVFTGDTIFADGGVGRTDFSYSEPLKLSVSLDRILSLPSATQILSGHGEETIVEHEKKIRLSV